LIGLSRIGDGDVCHERGGGGAWNHRTDSSGALASVNVNRGNKSRRGSVAEDGGGLAFANYWIVSRELGEGSGGFCTV
jgi:hypothetical protein